MTLRSQRLDNGQPQGKPTTHQRPPAAAESVEMEDSAPVSVSTASFRRRMRVSRRVAGLFSLAIGAGLWLIGSRFTVLGTPFAVSALLGLFSIDWSFTLPSGWAFLAMTIAIGGLFSAVEFGSVPRRKHFTEGILAGIILLVVWLLINGADLASTYYGVIHPVADAWQVTRFLATNRIGYLWVAFLTYIPEVLILFGIRWLIRGR